MKTLLTSPIDLEVMRNAFQSVADEMTLALVRTAYSTNIKDRYDCSCALLTVNGDAVAQSEIGTPFHLAVLPASVKVMLARYPLQTLRPGDMLISNVPYPVGPGHLSDVTTMAPVFWEGHPVALVTNMAHQVDMGGFAPGSMPFGVTEIYQEGLQIPPVKLLHEGVLDPDVAALIMQNVRTASVTEGDIMAQVAANNVGIGRAHEILAKHSASKALAYMDELLDYAERSMRAGIAKIPQGVYAFEDVIEGDGITDHPIRVRATVTVGPDQIEVDFAGTDKQAKGPINTRISAAEACVYYTLKCTVDPELPTNSGAYRPIRVRAEEGSLVHATFPAAVCNANIITDQRYVDVLMGALLQAVPERLCAACSGEMHLINLGGLCTGTGKYFSYVETYGGGQGASYNADGMSGVHTHMTNTRNAPVEVVENTYPLRIHRYGLVPDSDGAGTYRGGLGMYRELELLTEEAKLSISSDRRKVAPWGAFGGRSAATSDCVVHNGNGRWKRLPSKVTTTLRRGERLLIKTPGGGGWGPPLDRDPATVAGDVRERYITVKRAREVYGVVVHPANFRVDAPATRELRAKLKAAHLVDNPPSEAAHDQSAQRKPA